MPGHESVYDHPSADYFDGGGVIRGQDGVLRYSQRPASLVEMLHRSVERGPGDEALVEVGGRRLSYREVWDEASKVAGGLRDDGVGRGDRVAIELPNGVDWCLAFLGVQLAGAIAVPVNIRFGVEERRYVLEDAAVTARLTPDSPLPSGRPLAVDDLGPRDPAGIFYTSGTTGRPKGAVTLHENLLSTTESGRRIRDLPRGETRDLVSVPLFHVTGCNSQFLTGLDVGGTVVVLPKFDVHAFIAAIEAEAINKTTSVPAIYWLALQQEELGRIDRSRLRWVSYGGAPCPPELVRRIAAAFPEAEIGNGFGLTECAAVSTYLPHEFAVQRAETVGLPVPVVELDLDAPDPNTGVGELLIRGGNVVDGYWRKPEATAETFIDGWLYTGDLARIDEAGFCEIVDRKKDMINRGGENVYSIEVENVLVQHADVHEAALVGLPDEMMGERVGAAVVPTPGSDIDPRELARFVADRLADFKVPEFVAIRDVPLPRNPGGKVLKAAVRDEGTWTRIGLAP